MKIILTIFILLTQISGNDIPDSVQIMLNRLNEEEQVKYLGHLCWENRVDKTDLAIEYGKQGAKLAVKLNLTHEIAQINNFLGVAYVNYNYDAKKAIMCFREALEAGLKAKDTIQIAYAYNNLGDVYIYNRNYPLALKYSKSATKYFEVLNNLRGISYSYINLGEVYRFQKKYDLSLNYLKKSLEIRKNQDNMFNVAGALFHIAETYFAMEDYKNALDNYESAIPYYEKTNDVIGVANCFVGLGNVQYKLGDYSSSGEKFNHAKKINVELGNDKGLVSVYTGLALVSSKTGKKTEGELLLKEALQLAKRLNLSSRIRDTYEAYSEFYLNLKDYKAATGSFKDFLSVYDSLLSVEREDIIAEIQKNYDIAQQVDAIQYDLEKGKIEGFYLELLIFLLIISALFLFWRYRVNRSMNKKLNQLNISKDKFFKVISHDLKSPFNSLMAFASMLYNDFETISREEHRDGLREIQSSADKVYKLLENLLDWSRVQTDTMEVNLERLNPGELIIQNCNLYKMSAKNKNITLDYKIPDDDCLIYADAHMFSSVIRNLLSNAIKFTPGGGNVSINYNLNNEKVLFEVRDNGIGIDSEIIDNIFDQDQNHSTSGTNQESGTGLGLLLCREFLTKMGGDILVESKKGIGSRFYFTLLRSK